jgi:hypothetical protein
MRWIGFSRYRNKRHPKSREVEKEMGDLEPHNMPGASVLEILM